jgi:release factor glutamine methyltransferase
LKKEDASKVFHYKDLTIELHSEVYDPAEDSFLLLEAINIKKDNSVLEIGTGCGLIALECARLGANVICTDINPFAVELVKKNYLMNQNILTGNFEVRLGDLFSPLISGETFDVIIFNPPYLPTQKKDLVGGWFDKATNGGKDGLLFTKRFIEGLPNYLKKDGNAYFIFSSLSDRNKLEKILNKTKLNYKLISSHSFNDETIEIFFVEKNREVD